MSETATAPADDDAYNARRDSFKSWELAVTSIREIKVRSGEISPSNEQERGQAEQGLVPVSQLDCMERWAPIPGFERYQVSSHGRVRSLARAWKTGGRPLRLHRDKGGYRFVAPADANGKHHLTVHRLVLLAFVGPPPTPMHQCRHLDGNRENNRLENLCWGSRVENEADKKRHGTARFGEGCTQAKLTESAVREIRAAVRSPTKVLGRLTGLARKFGVSPSTINNVVVGSTWQHVADEP